MPHPGHRSLVSVMLLFHHHLRYQTRLESGAVMVFWQKMDSDGFLTERKEKWWTKYSSESFCTKLLYVTSFMSVPNLNRTKIHNPLQDGTTQEINLTFGKHQQDILCHGIFSRLPYNLIAFHIVVLVLNMMWKEINSQPSVKVKCDNKKSLCFVVLIS